MAMKSHKKGKPDKKKFEMKILKLTKGNFKIDNSAYYISG